MDDPADLEDIAEVTGTATDDLEELFGDRSYGIHVARLAGVPKDVLDRARQLLGELAVQHVARPKVSGRRLRAERDANQMPLFVDPAVEMMRALATVDADHLSPMAAFELLRAWKAKFGR